MSDSAARKDSASASRNRASHPRETHRRRARSESRRRHSGSPVRVFIAAENRLLREALSRVLNRRSGVDVIATDAAAPFHTDLLLETKPDILLLTSRGGIEEDVAAVRDVRSAAPDVRVLLIGMAKNEREFLQCVRAGIHGYLLRDASAEEVLDGVHSVFAGDAVCPGSLCAVLFNYFVSDSATLNVASSRRRMGLSRREQQIIPLIAQGLTNKEIANHFSLSEQTVKNHLYRMKHKIGAEDRLEMVHLYRTAGFLI
jgi:DNA-binding NarL/FixJ family response regulator